MFTLVSHTFLEDLALVLCVAAITTVIFQKIRQPVVVGYLIAGLIVGPHVPIPLLVDAGRIHTLSELGVIAYNVVSRRVPVSRRARRY